MKRKLVAVSVDLDELPNYFSIHGLPLDPRAANLVYDKALARIAHWANALDVPITAFAIGSDLEREASARALRFFAAKGHAIENHSMHHLYDLTKQDRATIRREIEDGMHAIERVVRVRPTGFRAPGYTTSDDVFDALEELGVAWSSSVFPCPLYYSAKALVLFAMRLRGRSSASILDTPRVLTAPTRPYRPGRPWYRAGDRALLELPIQTTRGLRIPFIGTTLTLAGPTAARALALQCAGEELVNLELHGVDFLDANDGLEALAERQRDVAVPLAKKLDALTAAVRALLDRGHAPKTLGEAAADFA